MSNEKLEERQEREFHQLIANELGISIDELCQLEWEIDENSSDEGLVYSCIIQFSDDSPRRILDKIIGLTDTKSFELDASFCS